jgi:hypothetical protein
MGDGQRSIRHHVQRRRVFILRVGQHLARLRRRKLTEAIKSQAIELAIVRGKAGWE